MAKKSKTVDLQEVETDQLARLLAEATKEEKRIKQYVAELNEAMTDRLFDMESDGGFYHFKGVSYRLEKSGVRRTWERDALSRDLYRAACEGSLKNQISPDGELLIQEPEQRVYEAFKKAGRMEFRIEDVKDLGFDPDEYSTTSGGTYKAKIVGATK